MITSILTMWLSWRNCNVICSFFQRNRVHNWYYARHFSEFLIEWWIKYKFMISLSTYYLNPLRWHWESSSFGGFPAKFPTLFANTWCVVNTHLRGKNENIDLGTQMARSNRFDRHVKPWSSRKILWSADSWEEKNSELDQKKIEIVRV